MSSQPPKDDRGAKPEEGPDPARYDPWSGNRMAGMRWFAASTLIHAALLVLFATVSVTVRNTSRLGR